jgi:CRP-like cAMP-binding protein
VSIWHDGNESSSTGHEIEDHSAVVAEIGAMLGVDAPSPLQSLLSHARRVCYAPESTLYHEGTENNTVFFVTEGLLKLVSHLPSGRARIVRLHRQGSILGLNSVIADVNEHTAVALTPVTALQLPVSALERLRQEDANTYATLLERWHIYLQEADRWITEFSTGPIRGRVARLVAFLSEFEPEASGGQVRLLTCEEMAAILGVTPESVSRILAEFKRHDVLSKDGDEPDSLYKADVEHLRDIGSEE